MSQSVPLHDLQRWGRRVGFDLAEEALRPLAAYLDLLMQWNRVMNLVGTRTAEETFMTLVVDSLHLAAFLNEDWTTATHLRDMPDCWDLGSGAGLPGLPLRMLWQKGTYWMVEAREKRALFLSTVLARTPLPRTNVFRGRAEAFMAGPPRRTADLVVSRAFMPWPDVLTLVRSSLNPGGVVILLLREDVRQAPLWIQQTETWNFLATTSYEAGPVKRFLCALQLHSKQD